MGYVVFEDLETVTSMTTPGDLPVKIHRDSCHSYARRDVAASTVKWMGPFENLNEAESYARRTGKPWKHAQCCL